MARIRVSGIDLDQIDPERLNWINQPGRAYRATWLEGASMGLRVVLLTTIIAGVACAVANAQEGAGSVSQAELKAKTDYCKTCHGLSGQGFRGSFPMPRLAGQQPEYLKNQLQAFIERRRTNPVMFNVAHVLSPPMLEGLSTYFKNLDPKPLGGAPEGARGRREENL